MMDKITFPSLYTECPEIIEYMGLRFRVTLHYDNALQVPWKEYDGHGIIREEYSYYSKPAKSPGERIIHYDRGDYWIYDFAETLRVARREGWRVSRDRRKHFRKDAELTARQEALEAVLADMDYCREWLNGDRWYVWAEVALLDSDDEEISSDVLGGIESGYSDECEAYLQYTITEMMDGLARQHTKEQAEASYWAARDVVTV